jgi:hypothetical protein
MYSTLLLAEQPVSNPAATTARMLRVTPILAEIPEPLG